MNLTFKWIVVDGNERFILPSSRSDGSAEKVGLDLFS